MTSQFQRNIANNVIEYISREAGCIANVDDWNDYGSFSCFMALPIQNRLQGGCFGNVFLQTDVNLRKIVAAIKRACKKHFPRVWNVKIVCPVRKYTTCRGFKMFQGWESSSIHISFDVQDKIEKKPEMSIQEKRNSVPYGR